MPGLLGAAGEEGAPVLRKVYERKTVEPDAPDGRSKAINNALLLTHNAAESTHNEAESTHNALLCAHNASGINTQ